MATLRGAVIGSGNMGRHHVRIMSQSKEAELAYVVDTNITAARDLCAQWGGEALSSIDELPKIDVAVVAVPTQFHKEIALELIRRKVNLLIEKPLADNPKAAQEIVDAANQAGIVLAVGHVERFNPAVQELKQRLDDPKMISIERLSPYQPRIKDSVIYDLTVHDVDLACWLAGSEPIAIQAIGSAVFSNKIDVASAQIKFASGCIATLQTSRITQDKVRRILVSEPERFINVDMLKQDIEIKRSARVENKTEDGHTVYSQETISEIPTITVSGEPLCLEQENLYCAIATKSKPLVTGDEGLRAVELVNQIEKLANAQ